MRWLLLLILSVLLASCTPRPERQWTEIPPAEKLLARLELQSGQYRSLDAVASVHLTARGKYFSSQQFLLLERPDRLRADVLTGFGQLVMQLSSDGKTLAVFLNNSVPGKFLRGPANYANISRFIRIPLAPEDLLALLLYDPPLMAYTNSQVTVDGNRLQLLLSSPEKRQELLFDARLRLSGCRYYVKNELQLSVSYEEMSDQEPFPHKVKIETPLEDTRITLEYSELKLNVPIDTKQFQLQKPANAVAETLP